MVSRQSGSSPGPSEAQVRRAFDLSREGRAVEARAAMEQAASNGHAQAAIFAAIWRLIGYAGDVEPSAAASMLRKAVGNGEPAGLTMLAALAVSDLEGPRDWDRAASLLVEAAASGEHRAMTQLALLLPGSDPSRRGLLHRAAALGNGTAAYFFGRLLCDTAAEREEGVRWLVDVANRGEPCSLSYLIAQGVKGATGAPAVQVPSDPLDWQGIRHAICWPHERALPEQQPLRETPRIASAPRLLSLQECEFLISRGAPYLQPAQVAGEGGAAVVSRMRSNDSMLFSPADTDVLVQSIDSLIARVLGSPPANGERLAMLRYRPGQSYAPHCDWIDPRVPGKAEQVAARGQRIATLLVYLNEGYSAGETRFVQLDWSFKGRCGDALLWSNVKPDGSTEPLTLHEGRPPVSGEKWLLSKWMRDCSQAEAPGPG
jgi:hypothetical protein